MSDSQQAHSPIFHFFRCIHIIQHLSQHRIEKALPEGMLLPHFSVLSHLAQRQDSSPAELAADFQVTRPSMTNTLGKLKNMGFISISANPDDGRAKRIVITENGRKAQQSATTQIAPLFADIVEALGVQTFTDLLPGISKVKTFLDENRF